jgi:hypothetical protein
MSSSTIESGWMGLGALRSDQDIHQWALNMEVLEVYPYAVQRMKAGTAKLMNRHSL